MEINKRVSLFGKLQLRGNSSEACAQADQEISRIENQVKQCYLQIKTVIHERHKIIGNQFWYNDLNYAESQAFHVKVNALLLEKLNPKRGVEETEECIIDLR